jgi:hypothetical protein
MNDLRLRFLTPDPEEWETARQGDRWRGREKIKQKGKF